MQNSLLSYTNNQIVEKEMKNKMSCIMTSMIVKYQRTDIKEV